MDSMFVKFVTRSSTTIWLPIGYGCGAEGGVVTTKLVVRPWPKACEASNRNMPANSCVRIGFIFFNSGVGERNWMMENWMMDFWTIDVELLDDERRKLQRLMSNSLKSMLKMSVSQKRTRLRMAIFRPARSVRQ